MLDHKSLFGTMLVIIMSISFVGAASSAQVGNVTGGDLHQYCATQSDEAYSKMLCRGYVIGLMEGAGYGTANTLHLLDILGERHAPTDWGKAVSSFLAYCPADTTSHDDLITVLVQYLEKNKDRWDERASDLVWEALREKYPCN